MTFDADFFKDEEREGFLVPSLMKKTWAAELKTLQALLDFCRQHDLRIYADFGTLLGAIRHKGFIPWDDDLDLSMPRKDYMKLIELADTFPAPYRIKSIYTMERFSQFHIVLSNSKRERFTYAPELIRDFYGCPFFIGIDITPMDYIPRDPQIRRMQQILYKIGYQLSTDLSRDYIRIEDGKITEGAHAFSSPSQSIDSPEEFQRLLQSFEKYTVATLPLDGQLQKNVMLLTDRIAMRFGPQDGDEINYYARMAYWEDATPSIRPASLEDEFLSVPFENLMIPVPKDYEKLLSLQYGPDWRTPVREESLHDYPFYRTQLELLSMEGHTEFS
ncbi:lipopolysaccharide cholinephosphotransferase [Lachnospiraceae bacterium KHCPX20]|nr:lipopolysaccharide cholinephosphotransferase [Lachnospiraceae bacterium KHCPX20]